MRLTRLELVTFGSVVLNADCKVMLDKGLQRVFWPKMRFTSE